MKGKTVEIICTTCGTKIPKRKAEVTRQIKKGRSKFYCNLSCAAIQNNKSPNRKPPTFVPSGRQIDNLSPFRWFLRGIRRREDKKGSTDLTLEYLADLWENQKGKCPFTNWQMILPRSSNGTESPSPKNASLDRINNSLGYIKGNVRFVSLMANYARNTFLDEDIWDFGYAIVRNLEVGGFAPPSAILS